MILIYIIRLLNIDFIKRKIGYNKESHCGKKKTRIINALIILAK